MGNFLRDPKPMSCPPPKVLENYFEIGKKFSGVGKLLKNKGFILRGVTSTNKSNGNQKGGYDICKQIIWGFLWTWVKWHEM